tara:strand:+ start:100 stop:591 length:492 start_codon:yes stop_codon:yes gene_type:complete
MPSFDIVSQFDMQELDNAVNMVKRDISNRYDFKGSSASLELNKAEESIKIEADNEYQIKAVSDMLEKRAISRKISIRIFDYSSIDQAAGMSVRQIVKLKKGIDKDCATKINKLIKSEKMKVQSQIQGDQLRVTGKKIDDLQSVILLVKDQNYNLPLQFINMRG